MTPTAAQLFDAFLAHRGRTVTARTVKQFVLWMERLDELDCCSSLSLQALCDEHAPPPQRRRRAGPWPRR